MKYVIKQIVSPSQEREKISPQSTVLGRVGRRVGNLTNVLLRFSGSMKDVEKTYQLNYDNLNEGIALISKDEKFIFANKSFAEVLGVDLEVLKGKNLMDFLDEEACQEILRQTQMRVEGKESVYLLKFIRPDGEIRIVRVIAYPHYYPNGEFCFTFGRIEDITEQENAKQRQIRKELLSGAINEIANAVGSTIDIKDLCIKIHEIIKQLIPEETLSENFYLMMLPRGIRSEDVMPETSAHYVYYKDKFELLPDDEITEPLGNGLTYRVIKKGKLFHCDKETEKVLLENGEMELIGADSYDGIWVPLFNPDNGEAIGALAIQSYSDAYKYDTSHEEVLEFISKQIALAIRNKEKEKDLFSQKEELIRQSLELTRSLGSFHELMIQHKTGYAMVDENEIIISANEVLCDLFGVSSEELIGESILAFAATEDDKNRILGGTDERKKGERSSYVIKIRVKNPNYPEQPESMIEKEVRISGTPRYDASGKLLIEALIEDYSYVKALEKAQMMDPAFEILNTKAAQISLKKLISLADRKNYKIENGLETTNKGVTLGFVDVDFLKYINEVNSYPEGTRLIGDTIRALKIATKRETDELYRWGGDEFLLVLQDCTSEAADRVYRGRLQDAIALINKERITEYHNYLLQCKESGLKPTKKFVPLSLSVGFEQMINVESSTDGKKHKNIDILIDEVERAMKVEKYKTRGKLALKFGLNDLAAAFILLAFSKSSRNFDLKKFQAGWKHFADNIEDSALFYPEDETLSLKQIELLQLYKQTGCDPEGTVITEEDARSLSSKLCEPMTVHMMQEMSPETWELYQEMKDIKF